MSTTGVTVMYLVKAAEGVSNETFDERWGALGPPAVDGLDGFVRVSPLRERNDTRPEEAAQWVFGSGFPYGGLAELTFSDHDAWLGAQDAVHSHFADGLERLADPAGAKWLATREHLVVGEALGDDPIKATFFLHRVPELTVKEFQLRWGKHGPLAALTPKLRRYVQHHAALEQYAEGGQPHFDGVAQLSWDTMEELQEAYASYTMLVIQPADAEYFVHGDVLFGFLGSDR